MCSNATASHNGAEMEAFARSMLPNATITAGNEDIDGNLGGVPLEIKSCQICIIDNSHTTTGKRSGRFVFSGDQHKALIEAGGEYLLIVHKEGSPFLGFRAPAFCLDLPDFTGNRAVSWRVIVSQLAEVV